MYTNNQFPETFDKKLVGKYLASGGDCNVYRYGEHHVVKFSRFSEIGGKKISNKLQSDYQFCKNYFGDYVLETRFFKTKRSRHTEIQPFVKGKELHITDLANPDVVHEVKKSSLYLTKLKMKLVGK